MNIKKRLYKILFFTLALLFACQAIFAATGDSLVISTSVAEVEPVFIIQGSFDYNFINPVDGTPSGANLNPPENIDITKPNSLGSYANTLTGYFRVVQTNDVRSKKTYNITITATELVNEDNNISSNNSTSDIGYFYNSHHTQEGSALKVTQNITNSAKSKVYTFTAAYSNTQLVPKDTVLLTMSFAWTSNASLVAGTYKATITITYAAT